MNAGARGAQPWRIPQPPSPEERGRPTCSKRHGTSRTRPRNSTTRRQSWRRCCELPPTAARHGDEDADGGVAEVRVRFRKAEEYLFEKMNRDSDCRAPILDADRATARRSGGAPGPRWGRALLIDKERFRGDARAGWIGPAESRCVRRSADGEESRGAELGACVCTRGTSSTSSSRTRM